jgi:lipopolysaccharide transport system permease protein
MAGIADFCFSSLVLLGMMLFYKLHFSWKLFTLPLFILLALLSAIAVGLWLSAMNVKYRDIRYVVPFLTQFWMYATPVAYSISLIPEEWLWLYSLNPMVSVVEGFRWAILGDSSLNLQSMAISTIMVFILLVSGLFYFKRMEAGFADII